MYATPQGMKFEGGALGNVQLGMSYWFEGVAVLDTKRDGFDPLQSDNHQIVFGNSFHNGFKINNDTIENIPNRVKVFGDIMRVLQEYDAGKLTEAQAGDKIAPIIMNAPAYGTAPESARNR